MLSALLSSTAHAAEVISTTSPASTGSYTIGTQLTVGGAVSGLNSNPYYTYDYKVMLYMNSDDNTHHYGPLQQSLANSSVDWSLTWNTTNCATGTYELDAYLMRTLSLVDPPNWSICAGSCVGGQTLTN